MYSTIQFKIIKYIVKYKMKKTYPKLQDNIFKYIKYHTMVYYQKKYLINYTKYMI